MYRIGCAYDVLPIMSTGSTVQICLRTVHIIYLYTVCMMCLRLCVYRMLEMHRGFYFSYHAEGQQSLRGMPLPVGGGATAKNCIPTSSVNIRIYYDRAHNINGNISELGIETNLDAKHIKTFAYFKFD